MNNLEKLEVLELRNVNLNFMKQINFETFSLLIKLDLSFNQLTRIDSEHFLTLNSLEFLDLSHNKIDFLMRLFLH